MNDSPIDLTEEELSIFFSLVMPEDPALAPAPLDLTHFAPPPPSSAATESSGAAGGRSSRACECLTPRQFDELIDGRVAGLLDRFPRTTELTRLLLLLYARFDEAVVAAAAPALILTDSNEEENEVVRRAEDVECALCNEPYAVEGVVMRRRLTNARCGHAYCAECLQRDVMERQVVRGFQRAPASSSSSSSMVIAHSPQCLAVGCPCVLSLEVLDALGVEEDDVARALGAGRRRRVERLRALARRQLMDANLGREFMPCPSRAIPPCEMLLYSPARGLLELSHVECDCGHKFCPGCRELHHAPMNCQDAARARRELANIHERRLWRAENRVRMRPLSMAALARLAGGSSGADDEDRPKKPFVPEDRTNIKRARGENVVPEDPSEAEVFRTTESCPQCGVKTTKVDGCNHLKCARCYTDWCWKCVERLRECQCAKRERMELRRLRRRLASSGEQSENAVLERAVPNRPQTSPLLNTETTSTSSSDAPNTTTTTTSLRRVSVPRTISTRATATTTSATPRGLSAGQTFTRVNDSERDDSDSSPSSDNREQSSLRLRIDRSYLMREPASPRSYSPIGYAPPSPVYTPLSPAYATFPAPTPPSLELPPGVTVDNAARLSNQAPNNMTVNVPIGEGNSPYMFAAQVDTARTAHTAWRERLSSQSDAGIRAWMSAAMAVWLHATEFAWWSHAAIADTYQPRDAARSRARSLRRTDRPPRESTERSEEVENFKLRLSYLIVTLLDSAIGRLSDLLTTQLPLSDGEIERRRRSTISAMEAVDAAAHEISRRMLELGAMSSNRDTYLAYRSLSGVFEEEGRVRRELVVRLP